MKILSVIRIIVDKQFDYGYLKEIMVHQANQKEYTFKEVDFKRLYLNDIEDMLLLYFQNKLHHLKGHEQVDLVDALRLFIGSIVLKKRVKDVQLRVESYQMKLNVTMPQITCLAKSDSQPHAHTQDVKFQVIKKAQDKDFRYYDAQHLP
ncbi:hypothetical protein Tco_1020312 [Tanacetum coccineum]|uniref:Uncharacterized protein n=1 Tax=Tanacetum coccineum TaxID=301880 RepID=A0ABQ5G1I1_9ASTR